MYKYKPFTDQAKGKTKSPAWNYFGFAKIGGALDTTIVICR